MNKLKYKILICGIFGFVFNSVVALAQEDFYVPYLIYDKLKRNNYELEFTIYNLNYQDTLYLEVPYPYSIDMNLIENYFVHHSNFETAERCFYDKNYGIDTVYRIYGNNGKSISYKVGSNFDFVKIPPRGNLKLKLNFYCRRKNREIDLKMRYSNRLTVLSSKDPKVREGIFKKSFRVNFNRTRFKFFRRKY